jgi:succinyl-diaminopimelate desuccinylase
VIDPTDPVALAQALIRCRSVTPVEGGALALLESVLGAEGFTVERMTFRAEGTPDVENLYARIGTTGPVLVLAGHTDVVPPGTEADWRLGPFEGAIEDGVLYGRGAVDMKGGVAAMAAAAIRQIRAGGLTGSIAFLITGDEEGPAVNGTPKLLEWARARGERFDHCLLGEPSSVSRLGDMIKIGRRGSLSGVLTVHGRQGHVAYPHLADNPVRRVLPMLDALMQPLDQGTELFQPSNLEVTSVDVSNPTVNLIPARAVARFNVRFNDAHSLDGLKALLSQRIADVAGDARYEIAFDPAASESFYTGPEGRFVALINAAVEAETGIVPEASTGGGTSDARFIKNHCPVVELGLLNTTMHAVDERVPVADLAALTRIYEGVIARYFAG